MDLKSVRAFEDPFGDLPSPKATRKLIFCPPAKVEKIKELLLNKS